jgi:glutamine amidotransferase
MKPVITIVDYGVGNLLSVVRAFEYCGAQTRVESSPNRVVDAEYLVLPGVGAFSVGMAELRQRGLVDALHDYAASGRPLLGICLGMQLLLDGSDEFGACTGLGLVHGWARKLPSEANCKLPNVGWGDLQRPDGQNWESLLPHQLQSKKDYYFVHSYYADLQNMEDILAQSKYGDFLFCSALKKENISGYQFHPEKSGEAGLHLLANFIGLASI